MPQSGPRETHRIICFVNFTASFFVSYAFLVPQSGPRETHRIILSRDHLILNWDVDFDLVLRDALQYCWIFNFVTASFYELYSFLEPQSAPHETHWYIKHHWIIWSRYHLILNRDVDFDVVLPDPLQFCFASSVFGTLEHRCVRFHVLQTSAFDHFTYVWSKSKWLHPCKCQVFSDIPLIITRVASEVKADALKPWHYRSHRIED